WRTRKPPLGKNTSSKISGPDALDMTWLAKRVERRVRSQHPNWSNRQVEATVLREVPRWEQVGMVIVTAVVILLWQHFNPVAALTFASGAITWFALKHTYHSRGIAALWAGLSIGIYASSVSLMHVALSYLALTVVQIAYNLWQHYRLPFADGNIL